MRMKASTATSTVVPVPEAALQEHYAAALQARQRDERRERRSGASKNAAILLLVGCAGFLTWRNERLAEIAAANANKAVYVTLRDDGTLINSVAYTSLPQRYREDNRLNTLWNYVFWRECYSRAEAPRAYYNVQRMSDDRVRKEWVTHFSRSNPTSPQNLLGAKGHYYTCEPVGYAPVGADGDRYQFRFMRFEHDDMGRKDQGILMYATVAFRTGVYDDGPNGWIDRVVFNGPGIQVWEYPGARPEGLQPHLLVNAGGGKP
jgi:VirB8 protein